MLFAPLFAHAEAHPDDIVIRDDLGQYTWKRLAETSAALGMFLRTQTDRPNVGVLLAPGAGFAASFYGTLLAGKTVVPINYLLGDREVAHVIKDSGIDTVLTIEHPMLSGRLKDSGLKLIDLLELANNPFPPFTPHFPSPSPDELAVIMYTSGTSGLPKGVMLTHGNLLSDVQSAIQHAQLQGKHTFLGIIPLFHSTGMLATLLAPITLGTSTFYIARFSPVATLKAIREHKLSVITAVPSMYGALLNMKDATPADFAHVYACISGGEPLPAKIRDAFLARFGVPIYEGYGLTETIGPIAFNFPGKHRPGSVGTIIPGASAKIVDDLDQPAAPGQSGEVWLKGPMVMKGYYNLPEESARALTADGYFKTGDLGMLDADGFLHITGRKKDLIISAGEKIVPREVEEVIARHPQVAEAAVVGKKDPSRGEVVVAFVVAKDPALNVEHLRQFCRDQGLPVFKVPREVFIVAEFPRTPTGKILKRELSAKVNP